MLSRFRRHLTLVVCSSVLLASWVTWPTTSLDARSAIVGEPVSQSASVAKKPLSYDAYDAWWSIQGTTLSRDGEWLAYALTSQGLDGQLVV
jgi:hypothetical protein